MSSMCDAFWHRTKWTRSGKCGIGRVARFGGGGRRARLGGVVRCSRESEESRRSKEMKERLEQLAEDKEIASDEELLRLWEELQGKEGEDPEEKAKAKANMQLFLKDLFQELSSTKEGDFLSGRRVKEVFKDLPPDMVRSFQQAGIWDRLPNAGFAAGALETLQLWTEEEYKVFNEDPNQAPPVDEDEEIRKELMLLSAVRKLEDFFRSYPEDPAEVLNMMVAGKMAFEAKKNPFNFMDSSLHDVSDGLEDEELESMIDVDEIEACLQALEEGEDAPPPDPEKETVIEAESPEVFKKRMKLMQDYYWYPHRKREDREMSKAEYVEIRKRWEEFMPDEEPLYFQDISHIRLPPDWPEWMERHFRSLQHITYILRAAHINARVAEPGKRLKKYDRISPNVTYRDPATQLQGYEAFVEQMERLEAAGVTTEPNTIFGDCQPPEKIFDDPEIENPWSYTIVVDHHLNLLIPDWYHEILDEFEAQLPQEDLIQQDDPLRDEERYQLTESMDRLLKKKKPTASKSSRRNKKREKTPHPSEVASEEQKAELDRLGVGVKDGDPALYDPVYVPEHIQSPKKKEFKGSGKLKGDFWYEGPRCEAWKDGYYITINATLLYKLDIQSGQVCDIQMRWGAILGSVLAAEDVEKIFCEASGVNYDQRRYQHNFTSEWREFEYKPIRQNPLQWFKENIMGIPSSS